MASVQARQLDRTAGLQATFAAAMDMETNISILSTNDDDGDYEDAIIEIEHLHSLGVPSADISKLKSAGVVSVAGAMMTSKKVRYFCLRFCLSALLAPDSNLLFLGYDGD